MDPVSILGLIASVGGVADIVSRSISKLSHFRAKYREAPFIIAVLLGQLCTIRTALDQLEEWSKNNLNVNPRYEELSRQLEDALMSFQPLLAFLDNQLVIHDREENKQVIRKKRMSFVWKEQDLKGYFQMLDCQVNALTLLLQAVQCKTWTEQSHLMATVDSKMILRSAQDCSSSIMAHNDGTSTRNMSGTLENGDAMSQMFDFDQELLHSRVYHTAYRSHLKQIVTAPKSSPQPLETMSIMSDEASTIHPVDTLSAFATPSTVFFSPLERYSFESTCCLVKKDTNGIRRKPAANAGPGRYAVLFEDALPTETIVALTEACQIQKVSFGIGNGGTIRAEAKPFDIDLVLGRPLAHALGWIAEQSPLVRGGRDTPAPRAHGFFSVYEETKLHLCVDVAVPSGVKGGKPSLLLSVIVRVTYTHQLPPTQRFFHISCSEFASMPTSPSQDTPPMAPTVPYKLLHM